MKNKIKVLYILMLIKCVIYFRLCQEYKNPIKSIVQPLWVNENKSGFLAKKAPIKEVFELELSFVQAL